MCPQLRTPFHSLSADNFLSRGSAGQVFAISQNVVFKCPTLFDDPAPAQKEEMEQSIKKIENEKAVYQTLIEHRHPNVIHCILLIPEGLFLQRLEMTLESRIAKPPIISPRTQERWIRQLASAVAWIEELGLVHGDLRPANILLDAREEIKLGDFDATVRKGEQLIVASEPFCKLDEDFEPPEAGPVSEQFSLASCIYNIRFGHKPWHDLEAPTRVQKLIRNEFPPTSADTLFGDLTRKCWDGTYDSINTVKLEILSKLDGQPYMEEHLDNALEGQADGLLLAECQEFLEKENLTKK